MGAVDLEDLGVLWCGRLVRAGRVPLPPLRDCCRLVWGGEISVVWARLTPIVWVGVEHCVGSDVVGSMGLCRGDWVVSFIGESEFVPWNAKRDECLTGARGRILVFQVLRTALLFCELHRRGKRILILIGGV